MGRGQELLDAAREGDRRTVEKIIGQITKRSGPFTSLRRGAGVNVQDENGFTPLHHACVRGHKEIVQLLLSVDASPCIVDKVGATALHLAVWKGDANIVHMLLNHKNPPVSVDQRTSDQETALLIAARSGFVAVVEQLIAYGADVTLKNIKDETALDLAAQLGRFETVQLLLQVRPQLVDPYKYPISRGRLFSSTPLHLASKFGHKEVAHLLISAGVDPNVRTQNGTPLHEAACFGKASVVRLLLAKGADLNAVDRRGKTVHDLLADYSEEATRRVRKVIKDYEQLARNTYESEEDLPPFPVQDCSPSYPHAPGLKPPETQKVTNPNSLITPSSSSITKSQSQSFVKKLASKCLGLKAKFYSAPNINNSSLEPAGNTMKSSDSRNSTNTINIGNSKFFKKQSKKEDTGEVLCNDEFDTISLDRLSALNRDSSVNRSNRSCPGFKTSLPNISENELTDSTESSADSVVITEIDGYANCPQNFPQATNFLAKLKIEEAIPEETIDKISESSTNLDDSVQSVNECYVSYDIKDNIKNTIAPTPLPRPTLQISRTSENTIYENVDKVPVIPISRPAPPPPVPASRTHIPPRVINNVENKEYEYAPITQVLVPEPTKRTVLPKVQTTDLDLDFSPSSSRSSTLSSNTDSMLDETNLEDILLSKKSNTFRHSKDINLYPSLTSFNVTRTCSNASDLSQMTEASAMEHVDCSAENNDKSLYLSMTGTLPGKKTEDPVKRKVLFRHKTFTNIEVDKNSIRVKDFSKWNDEFLKETLPNYHIRGTGHCIYKAPTVKEFIYIFNRETLYSDVEPFTKVPNDKRDSYYETAICFCRPRPPKRHNSAEDLLEIAPAIEGEDAIVTINFDNSTTNRKEIISSSFRCFCDSEDCKLHDKRRESLSNHVVKFSVIKKSLSTPDITLESSPLPTVRATSGLPKVNSVPSHLEEPYAVVKVEDIVLRNKISPCSKDSEYNKCNPTLTSQVSTLSSTSGRPYSIKDISDAISLSSTVSGRPYSVKDISEAISLNSASSADSNRPALCPLRKTSSEHSGHWSLQSCNSNVTIKSDTSFKTCIDESDDNSDGTLNSEAEDDDDSSDAETIKSDISRSKRPWVHSDSFRFGAKNTKETIGVIVEEDSSDTKFESGISVGSEFSSSDDSGVLRGDVSLDASLERGAVVGGVRSGSGRRRWDEAEGTSEGDALSVSSAASSCAPLHLAHHHEYSKVSPTPPQKPPRRNLSVSPTHANSPSSGYSYELRAHARSQDDLDDIQGAKHYLKHGRSVDQYVDGKLSYSEYEENHNSPRIPPQPNPRPSLKNRQQPVAITAMYENVAIKEQNPRRKLKRNSFNNPETFERPENRVRKYSNQERSSLESLLDDSQSMNSPSDCERYEHRIMLPTSPTHYDQPPTPDHPPPSAKQAEKSIHETIRPLSQLIMEVVEEIRIRKKSQGDVANS